VAFSEDTTWSSLYRQSSFIQDVAAITKNGKKAS
jgi:hypothetical protein